MKLDLSEIARIPGSYAEHEINMTFKEIEGMTLTAPVQGKMFASSTGRVLLLEGAVDTEVEQVCARCGAIYRQPVHAEFQEDFVVRPPQAPGKAPGLKKKKSRTAASSSKEPWISTSMNCCGKASWFRCR